MKLILLITLLFTSLAFSREVPLPQCVMEKDVAHIRYASNSHFYMDFCSNSLGINTINGCHTYIINSDQKILQYEISNFLEKRASKICGK